MQTLRRGGGVEEKQAYIKLRASSCVMGMRGFWGQVGEAAWRAGMCKVNFSYSVPS